MIPFLLGTVLWYYAAKVWQIMEVIKRCTYLFGKYFPYLEKQAGKFIGINAGKYNLNFRKICLSFGRFTIINGLNEI